MTAPKRSASVGAIAGADGTLVQDLLAETVAAWRDRGIEVCGLLGEPHDLVGRACSGGLLRNIVTGIRFPMYLEEPPAHTSCHLDESGVVSACASVLRQIAGSDLVVLNKFGKVEAGGSGLFEAFETAVALGKPVLTSVAPKHHYAWLRFAPQAVFVRPERVALEAWLESVLPRAARSVPADPDVKSVPTGTA